MVDLQTIRRVKKITGVNFRDAKLALEITQGDVDKAVQAIKSFAPLEYKAIVSLLQRVEELEREVELLKELP